MGAKKSGSAGGRVSPRFACALAVLFVLGAAVAVGAPAVADISPPTTTILTNTSGPSPDRAPKPKPKPTTATTTKTAPAKTPAPKPPATTSKPAPAPPKPASVPETAPQTTSSSPSPATPAPVHAAVTKVARPAHRAKVKVKTKVKAKVKVRTKVRAKAKAAKAEARKPKTTKPKTTKPKPHAVLAARATKHALPTSQISSPAFSDNTSGGLRNAVVILLFLIPAIALGAAFVPPQAVPHRMALVWRDARVNVGLLAGAVLLVEGLLYLLTR